jgi:hypothetical protein
MVQLVKTFPKQRSTPRSYLTSAYHDEKFTATLYRQYIEEDGSYNMDFLRSVAMDIKGELTIRTSDELVMMWDIDDLNRELVSIIREMLHKQHHWLLSDTKLERAQPRYQLEVFGFFLKYPDFNSFEWYYLKEFIERIPWSLRNRFMHEKDFPRFIDFLSGKHTSKSVRKALFKSFNESIEKRDSIIHIVI